MTSRTKHEADGSINSARLAALLDKLVAVELDLKPICKVGEEAPLVIVAAEAIAEACDTLHSAIADLRNILRDVEGLPYPLLQASRLARRASP